jgi:hypothetical protein
MACRSTAAVNAAVAVLLQYGVLFYSIGVNAISKAFAQC